MGSDIRRRQLARIHILKKETGLDEDDYRDRLESLTRKRSASELSHEELKAVIDDLRKLRDGDPNRRWDRDRPRMLWAPTEGDRSKLPMMRRIEAILSVMHEDWAYGHKQAWKTVKRHRLEFCKPSELQKVMIALDKISRWRHQKQEEAKKSAD